MIIDPMGDIGFIVKGLSANLDPGWTFAVLGAPTGQRHRTDAEIKGRF
ncbi:MAG: hypothetical protein HQL73_03600 [Magnetococcales bacterium]|nr:hypothetical protein [Magnetococcales bacterium]